jgi:hypothetical protein
MKSHTLRLTNNLAIRVKYSRLSLISYLFFTPRATFRGAGYPRFFRLDKSGRGVRNSERFCATRHLCRGVFSQYWPINYYLVDIEEVGLWWFPTAMTCSTPSSRATPHAVIPGVKEIRVPSHLHQLSPMPIHLIESGQTSKQQF